MKKLSLIFLIIISVSGCSMVSEYTSSYLDEKPTKKKSTKISKTKNISTSGCMAWDANGKCTVW